MEKISLRYYLFNLLGRDPANPAQSNLGDKIIQWNEGTAVCFSDLHSLPAVFGLRRSLRMKGD